MNRRELVRRVKTAAAELRTAAQWRGSGLEVDSKTNHYPYEFLCYLTAALAAAKTFEVEIVPRRSAPAGKLIARWPRSPGLKVRFSYIKLNGPQASPRFELCPGIRILDRYGKPRAADINLLRAQSPDSPTYEDLHAIWDAKYVYDGDKRLSDKDVADFAYTFEELRSPTPPPSWTQALSTAIFRYSGLLTNGDFSTEHDQALSKRNIYETRKYPRAPETRPKTPLRAVVYPSSKRRAGG